MGRIVPGNSIDLNARPLVRKVRVSIGEIFVHLFPSSLLRYRRRVLTREPLPVCLLRSKFDEDLGQVMFGILGSLEGGEKEGEKKEKKRKNVHLANRRAGWLVDEESCGLVCARVDRGRLRARVIFW